jgi:hypothetical protein
MNIHPRAKLGLAGRRALVATIEDGRLLVASSVLSSGVSHVSNPAIKGRNQRWAVAGATLKAAAATFNVMEQIRAEVIPLVVRCTPKTEELQWLARREPPAAKRSQNRKKSPVMSDVNDGIGQSGA